MTPAQPRNLSRRAFMGAAAAPFLINYRKLAAADAGHLKIRDVQTLIFQGPRTYTLVKIVSDDGLFGIG
jgi:hypothetical protein